MFSSHNLIEKQNKNPLKAWEGGMNVNESLRG